MMKNNRSISFGEAIREGLLQASEIDPSVIHFAEGVEDPSAVFGTLKDIGKEIGQNRMIEMPVSENALTGVAIGAALTGKRPVISFHRVEFAMLALEQIANNAAKFHYLSNGKHNVPLVMRLIIGRGWGQGPEHSQSLESVFAYFPGLKVVMPARPKDAKGMIIAAVEDKNPVLFIEHRWSHYAVGDVPQNYFSTGITGPERIKTGHAITVVATSYMTLEALRVADALERVDIDIELFDLRVLRPLSIEAIVESVKKTGKLLTIDTGFRTYGIGAEIVSSVIERSFEFLKTAPIRLGLPDHPTPSSASLIKNYYVDSIMILEKISQVVDIAPSVLEQLKKSIVNERNNIPIDVPDPFFKGPF
jgi:pyruvate dehydrogenase E1 component beta subunit